MSKIKVFGIVLILVGIIMYVIIYSDFKNDLDNYIIYQERYLLYDKVNIKEEIFGILQIDKINLEGVIYKKNSKKNDVNKNIYLANADTNKIVLAAHSGNSLISYFKDLVKLNKGDQIVFIKDDSKKTYEVFKIELVDKTGILKLVNYRYPILCLITCDKSNKDKQIVYYTRLLKNEYYG